MNKILAAGVASLVLIGLAGNVNAVDIVDQDGQTHEVLIDDEVKGDQGFVEIKAGETLAHIIHGVPRIYPRRAASAGLTAVF